MSEPNKKGEEKPTEYRIPAGSIWAMAWKIAGVIAAVGAAVSVAGYFADPHRFAFSYLFAFLVTVTLGLGAVFFVLIQYLTAAGWSVTVRRSAEFFLAGVPALGLMAVPVVFAFQGDLYPWIVAERERAAEAAEEGGHEGEHAEPAAAHGEPGEHHGAVMGPSGFLVNDHALHEEHEEVVAWKSPFLNEYFFWACSVVYLFIWIFMASRLWSWSVEQDKTKDLKLTVRAQRFAPGFTALFGLSLTFAAFHWVMSLEPTWFSTIYGVYIFSGSAITIFAAVILVTLGLRAAGHVGNAINTEHLHDLGKLMFGFNVFWAYIGFSQFMLIWYASIPEETTFFHLRWANEGWQFVSLTLLIAHFVMPFLFLISRNVKRRLPMLGFGAAWLLAMQVLDCYWLVMPYATPGQFSLHWMDVGTLFALVGFFMMLVFHRMTLHNLIPIGDPRLGRALMFTNA